MPTSLETRIEEYLHDTLRVPVRTAPWDGADRLPAFLAHRYRFATAAILDREVLLMLDEAEDPETPATLRKHVDAVAMKWSGPVVHVRANLTAYHRKRLIEQGIPFVVPGNQMYLPELGLDLREHFRAPKASRQRFRPSTQALLIHSLLRNEDGPLIARELVPVLGYSAMTMSRAFDELEAAGLAHSESKGRERLLHLEGSRREIWERAEPSLIDPVKSRHPLAHVPSDLGGLLAGESALARQTMLGDPAYPVFAVSQSRWKELRGLHADLELPERDRTAPGLQVWKYEPREHRVAGVVEPLSLWLSLRSIEDERVEQALEMVLKELPW